MAAQQVDPLMQLMLNFLGGSQDSSSSGNKSTTTGGTSSSTTGTTGTQTTKNSADVTALQGLFDKLNAGPTGADIASIFEQGAKQVPGLQAAYANASGLRTGDNTALTQQLDNLNANLSGKVLDLKTTMAGQAAQVGQAIAQLTSSSSTSQNQSSTNTQTSSGTTDEKNTGKGSLDTSINSDALRQLLVGGSLTGLLAGSSNGGIGPGIGDLLKGLTAGGKSLSDWLGGVDTSAWESALANNLQGVTNIWDSAEPDYEALFNQFTDAWGG